jgi:hypothetical protein
MAELIDSRIQLLSESIMSSIAAAARSRLSDVSVVDNSA